MEKKDWKQRLGSYDSWAMNESMFITIDGETIYTLDKLLDFIQQELDKAREEGRVEERDRIFWELDGINCVDEALPKNYSAAGMQFGINRVKEIVLQEELSKLKDNK